MHKLNKAQLERRKKRRARSKQVRQMWKLYLKEVTNAARATTATAHPWRAPTRATTPAGKETGGTEARAT